MQINENFLFKLKHADDVYFDNKLYYSRYDLEDYDLESMEKQYEYESMLGEEIDYERSFDTIERKDNIYVAIFGRILEDSDITFSFFGNKFHVYSIIKDFDIRGEYEDYEEMINKYEKNNFLDIFYTLKEYQKTILKREGL